MLLFHLYYSHLVCTMPGHQAYKAGIAQVCMLTAIPHCLVVTKAMPAPCLSVADKNRKTFSRKRLVNSSGKGNTIKKGFFIVVLFSFNSFLHIPYLSHFILLPWNFCLAGGFAVPSPPWSHAGAVNVSATRSSLELPIRTCPLPLMCRREDIKMTQIKSWRCSKMRFRMSTRAWVNFALF